MSLKMQTGDNLYEFLVLNFSTLPKDVLRYLMMKLSTKDLVALCSTSSNFKAECVRIGIYNTTLSAVAPLSQQEYGVVDQLKLIDRGYSTLYNAPIDHDNMVGPVAFGFPNAQWDLITREHIIKIVFSINGLPPVRGTKVWLMGHLGEFEEMHTWSGSGVMAFESRPSAIRYVRERIGKNIDDGTGPTMIIHDIALGIMDADIETSRVGGDIPKYMNIVLDALLDEDNSIFSPGLIFQEVTLP